MVHRDFDQKIAAKISAATEIYGSVLSSAKEMLEAKFGKPTSYYDGEKQKVLQIADAIFRIAVLPEDINRLANENCQPIDIIDATSNKITDNDSVKPGEKATIDSGATAGKGLAY